MVLPTPIHALHSLRPAVGATFGTVHCALENGLRTGAGVVRLCVLILRGIDGSEFEISGVEGVYERGKRNRFDEMTVCITLPPSLWFS